MVPEVCYLQKGKKVLSRKVKAFCCLFDQILEDWRLKFTLYANCEEQIERKLSTQPTSLQSYIEFEFYLIFFTFPHEILSYTRQEFIHLRSQC